MKNYSICKPLKVKEDYYVEFTDEELKNLNLSKGQKLSCEIEDGALKLTPFVKVDIDISEWKRDILEFLIKESCNQDISVNEIINNVLKNTIDEQL